MNTAKILGITKPLLNNDNGPLTVDEFIAYVARVSNPSNQNNTLTATKLLRYLAKHKHWSPFEMVSVVMEIETTRDIARQILRHRERAVHSRRPGVGAPGRDHRDQARRDGRRPLHPACRRGEAARVREPR